MTFSAEQKLAEVRRELKMRRKVYPEMVARGTLAPSDSARQIAVLEAIAEDYEAIVAQGDLFKARRA